MAEPQGQPANYLARISEWADSHLTVLRKVLHETGLNSVLGYNCETFTFHVVSNGSIWDSETIEQDISNSGEVTCKEFYNLYPEESIFEIISNISTGMAIAGIILFAKSIKLTTKFTSALDIPVEFIEKNVKLRGRLCHITEKGLEVEHVPISLPFLSSLQRKWQSNGVLLVRLAGVELTPNAMVWLQEELKPAQMMWFQLLGREDLVLDCLILVNKGRFFSVCLNEEILRQGLGKTTRIEGLHHDSPLYWKLHKRLLQAELKALKKNKGIWKEESYFEKLRDHISNNKFVQKLKQFANWLRIHI